MTERVTVLERREMLCQEDCHHQVEGGALAHYKQTFNPSRNLGPVFVKHDNIEVITNVDRRNIVSLKALKVFFLCSKS